MVSKIVWANEELLAAVVEDLRLGNIILQLATLSKLM